MLLRKGLLTKGKSWTCRNRQGGCYTYVTLPSGAVTIPRLMAAVLRFCVSSN